MKHIAVLITVHNRRDLTINCLVNLFSQQLPEGYDIKVYLTDDGCTDGTRESVESSFPQVRIVDGDGTLFWGGGMNAAWKVAVKEGKYDYFLWLNDDVKLYDGALIAIFNDSSRVKVGSIISGAFCDSTDNSVVTYGGVDSELVRVKPVGSPLKCKYVNGNMLLVSRQTYDVLGYIDKRFKHYYGDSDYAYRAANNGIDSYVTSKVLGECDRHDDIIAKWTDLKYSLKQRWLYFISPLGFCPKTSFIAIYRDRGFFVACKSVIGAFVKMLFAITIKLS